MLQSSLPIWVELRFLGRRSWFELHEGSRPLGIGSGWCTDLRILDPHVALVHCELVREGYSVRVLPTGSADVRLNAAHVGASALLPERCLLEFLGHEIGVVLHARLPHFEPPRHKSRAAFGDAGRRVEPPPVTLGHGSPRPLDRR